MTETATVKRCGRCHRRKPLVRFSKMGDGLQSYCIPCMRTYHRTRQQHVTGHSRQIRRSVPRLRVTRSRERALRMQATALLNAMPLAEQRDSMPASLLDVLDALRDSRSMCFRLRATARGYWQRAS